MKIIPLRLLLTYFLFFACYHLAAQEIWSLEKCIAFALEHNIQIKLEKNLTKVNKNQLNQSIADILPTINAGTNYSFSWGRKVDPFTNEFITTNVQSNNYNINSSMDLFNGFQKINTIRQQQFNLLASLQDIEKLRNDISLSIATAYLQILYNEEILSVYKNQVLLSEQQVERTKKLVELGSLPRGNLLEIQAQKSTEDLQVINAENQLRSSYLILQQFLELDATSDFKIEYPKISEPDENDIIPSVSSVFKEAQGLPQVKSAEYLVQSSVRGLYAAKGLRSPRLSLNLAFGTGFSDARKLTEYINDPQPSGLFVKNTGDLVYSPYKTIQLDYPFKDQFRDNYNSALYFGLSVPVFNGLQIQSAVSNARIDLENSKLRLQLAKNQLYKDIQQAYSDALSALAKFKGTRKTLEAIKESFKYTEHKYNVGLVTSIEYNTAKNQLNKTESELLQAKYEYIFKKNVLNFYQGVPIKF